MEPEEGNGNGLRVLDRLLFGGSDPSAPSRSPAGPYTSVPLLGWFEMLGSRCSCASFIPALTLALFVADTVLAIFAGLDAVDRGTGSPWLQFSYSIAVAAMYLALFVFALVQYRWERVLRYRYHWVLVLFVATVLAWSNFGIWASWQSRFSSFGNGVTAADGNAFVTWVAVNALGVAGYFGRFLALMLGQALRYTYSRTIELQGLVVDRTSGGRGLGSLMAGGPAGRRGPAVSGAGWPSSPDNAAKRGTTRGTARDTYARRFQGTRWGDIQGRRAGHV